jgi:hypothetical protein
MSAELPKQQPSSQHVWERGWDEHERLQQERLDKLTLEQKIEWLEEAHRIVRHMNAERQPTDPPSR